MFCNHAHIAHNWYCYRPLTYMQSLQITGNTPWQCFCSHAGYAVLLHTILCMTGRCSW